MRQYETITVYTMKNIWYVHNGKTKETEGTKPTNQVGRQTDDVLICKLGEKARRFRRHLGIFAEKKEGKGGDGVGGEVIDAGRSRKTTTKKKKSLRAVISWTSEKGSGRGILFVERQMDVNAASSRASHRGSLAWSDS